jgi:hypothetical protein
MPYKIFTFVPAFGQQITAATFMTTHAISQTFMQKGIGFGISTLSFPDIAELRGMAMTVWYDSLPDASHMLFVDADMGFDPAVVLDMLMFDEPIVGSIYPQRRVPLSWAGSGTGEMMAERRGAFMRVEGVGMGCTLIRREVVAALIAQYPELIDTRIDMHPARDMMRSAGANRLFRFFEKIDMPERGVISEDLSFCLRAAKCGFPVWASIGHKMSHVGPYAYEGCYLDFVAEQERLVAAAQAGQFQPSALAPPVEQAVPVMEAAE